MAAAIAANEFIENRDQYATIDENIKNSVTIFCITYEKMMTFASAYSAPSFRFSVS